MQIDIILYLHEHKTSLTSLVIELTFCTPKNPVPGGVNGPVKI